MAAGDKDKPGLKWWEVCALAGIVVLGGWLRMSRLDLMEFRADQAEWHRLAVEQASGRIQLVGTVSSVGMQNPAMTVYLFSIPAVFSRDPVSLAYVPALCGTAAIAVGYFLARMWMSRPAALAAMLLFAVSPWATLMSRKIWAQDLLVFFVTCFFFFAVRWVKRGGGANIVAALFFLSVANQIHYSTPTLLPLVLVLMFWKREKANVRAWVTGLALYAVLWAPFVVFILRGGLDGSQYVGHGPTGGYLGSLARAAAWHVQLLWHGRFDSAADPWGIWRLNVDGPELLLTPVFALLFAGGVAATIRRAKEQRDLWLLLAWVALPSVILSFAVIEFHYLVTCWPGTFLMVGILVDATGRWAKGRMPRYGAARFLTIGAVFLVLLAAEGALFFHRFLSEVSTDGGTHGDYAISYREKLRVARYLVNRFPAQDFTLMDFTSERREESTYEYLYHFAGGRGKVLPLNVKHYQLWSPAYVLVMGDAESGISRKSTILEYARATSIGPLRLEEYVPAGEGTSNEEAN